MTIHKQKEPSQKRKANPIKLTIQDVRLMVITALIVLGAICSPFICLAILLRIR